MKKIITIGREFGSGGREIGKIVAKNLGYKFYDKELILLMAKESGLSSEFIEETGEKITSSLLFNVAMGGIYINNTFNNNVMPLSDKIFVVQSNVIKKLADETPCVIVGRCADYILNERTDCLNVFIHADLTSKINRAVNDYKLPQKNIEKEIKRRDKTRSTYYYYYTGVNWGAAKNYDITLNSSTLGLENCAEYITRIAKN